MQIVPDSEPPPRAILVVLPTWVGDFVMATPTLRAIRERFTDARITFLCEPNLRELVGGGDWMDDLIEWPLKTERSLLGRPFRRLVRTLREYRFDWVILLPNSFRSALTARLTGAKRRIGYNRDGRGLLLTDRLPVTNRRNGTLVPRPLVEYYADLGEALGCVRPGDRLELFTTPDCEESVETRLRALSIADHHPLVVISPGAKYGAAKCWPVDRFAAVADRWIAEDDATVVVTCGPGEERIAEQIAETAAATPRSPLTKGGKGGLFIFDRPRLSLGELKSLIRRSDLLICNDTGPRHLAKAFGVPVVTVFGPTHPEWTATSYEAERIVRIDVDCGPCQQRVCPLGHLKCMTGVTVDAVFQAGRQLRGATSGE